MPLERFIPFRKRDVATLCENLLARDTTNFRIFSTLLVNRIHYQYHEQLEALKNSYSYFDPNKDTRELQPADEENATFSQQNPKFSSNSTRFLGSKVANSWRMARNPWRDLGT